MFLSNGFNNQIGWEAEILCEPAPCFGLINLLSDTLLCPTQSATLDAGAGPYSYLWSTGETTQSITVDGPSLGGFGVYEIVLTTLDTVQSCTDRDTVIVTIDPCIGINELSNYLLLELYPNPSSGIFQLDISLTENISFNYSISDIRGRKINNSNIYTNQLELKEELNLSEFDKGIYFFSIHSDKGTLTKKLVIQ